MAVNYDKYIGSTSTHYISNSGHDENGKYNSGKAGDQGGEWELKPWYNRPWTVVLRHPDSVVRRMIAEFGIDAALNKNIGYDQYQRTSYWQALATSGYKPANVKTACEADCTAGVTANVKAIGYLLGIPELQKLSTGTYSGNMKANFTRAGFQALTAKKYLAGYNYLLPGDILLYENHHAATNITKGKNAVEEKPSETKIPSTDMATGYIVVKNGSYYVRAEANKNSEAISVVRTGEKLFYLGKTQNGWNRVYYNGVPGWLSSKAGSVIDVAIKELTVKRGNWHIRSGAGTSFKSLGTVRGGDKVRIIDNNASSGWYLVEYQNKNAYISVKAVEK